MKRQVTDALRAQFRPEFLNRVDEVIVFHAADRRATWPRSSTCCWPTSSARLAEQDLALELTPAARALIVREGTDPAFGARPLKRTIQRLVENPLARALLEGRVPARATRITADADPVSGTIVFSSERSTVVAEAGRRRDARSAGPTSRGGDAGAGAGRARTRRAVTRSTCRTSTSPKRDPGELVN